MDDNDSRWSFSTALRHAMERRRMRGKDLAAKLEKSAATISSWLHGRLLPDPGDFSKRDIRTLAVLLEIEPQALTERLRKERAAAKRGTSASTASHERATQVLADEVAMTTEFVQRRPDVVPRAIPDGGKASLVAINEFLRSRGYVFEATVLTSFLHGSGGRSLELHVEDGWVTRRRTFAPSAPLVSSNVAPLPVDDALRNLVRRLCRTLNQAFGVRPDRVLSHAQQKAVLQGLRGADENLLDQLVEHLVQLKFIERIPEDIVGSGLATPSLAAYRLRQLSEIAPEEAINAFGLHTGIRNLDFLLQGGLLLPPGNGLAVLIQGEPGTGKTLAALQLSAAVAFNGGVAIYLSAEEDASVLASRLAFAGYVPTDDEWPDRIAHLTDPGRSCLLLRRTELSIDEIDDGGTLVIVSVPDAGQFATQRDGLLQRTREGIARLRDNRPDRLIAWVWDAVDALGTDGRRVAVDELFGTVRAHGTLGILVSERDPPPMLRAHLADMVIELGYRVHKDKFKERVLEISKSRAQAHIRGQHAFSINPQTGIQVYPALQSLLSVWRRRVRMEGRGEVLSWDVPGVGVKFLGNDALDGCSMLLSGPPATFKLPIGLSLLVSELRRHATDERHRVMIISLREDRSAIYRIVQGYPRQLDMLMAPDGKALHPRVVMLHCPPDYYTAERMIDWIRSTLESLPDFRVSCVLFNSLGQLRNNSPLFPEEELFIAGLIELFKQENITSLFLGSEGAATNEVAYIFDNILCTAQSLGHDGSAANVHFWVSASGQRSAAPGRYRVTRDRVAKTLCLTPSDPPPVPNDDDAGPEHSPRQL